MLEPTKIFEHHNGRFYAFADDVPVERAIGNKLVKVPTITVVDNLAVFDWVEVTFEGNHFTITGETLESMPADMVGQMLTLAMQYKDDPRFEPQWQRILEQCEAQKLHF